MSGLDSSCKPCRLRGFLVFLIVAVLAAATLKASAPVGRWLLEDEIRDTSARWAAHIFGEIEDGTETAQSHNSRESYANLAGALKAALRSGVVNRVSVRNMACGCVMTVNGDTLAGQAPDMVGQLAAFFPGSAQDHGHHDHLRQPTPVADGSAGQPVVRLVEGAAPGEPDLGAEVTFLRTIGLDTYELRLFKDVTAKAARTRLMTAMGALIVTLTLAGAGVMIMRCAARSNRAAHLSEKQARYLAEHDTLTDLLNRFGFANRSAAMLQRCRDTGTRAFLFQVDADKFKDVNDVYGHATGDRVIQAIAAMLKGAFPETALASRLGGDEFAILVPETALSMSAEDFMKTLPTGTDVTSEDGDSLIEISTSIGYAVYPDDARELGDLMKAADLALYAVKDAGRNAVGAYRRDMTKALERRHWELQGVREAIERGFLTPYYQPLISARTGRIEGVEALARWRHPNYGVLGPERFRHALEDPRVSTEITAAMLEQVAHDLTVWRNIGHDFSAGLNIGEADLKDPDLPARITEVLAGRGLPPGALAIEVTESALTSMNTSAAGPLLQRYRDAGGFVALDDFGTGNSSIKLLKDVPYSAVKIDRSFIRDLTHNQTDLAIVRSIVRMAREMGFKTVAEGIETPEQARLLRKMRVDLLQGFLFSKPLPARQLTELLEWASPPRKRGPENDGPARAA